MGLSQKAYIKRVLERFVMENGSSNDAPVLNGDKFSLMLCPKNDWESKHLEWILYASDVGSLMYTQTCTRPDISFTVGVLGRYESNPRIEHGKLQRKSRGTCKEHMITFLPLKVQIVRRW